MLILSVDKNATSSENGEKWETEGQRKGRKYNENKLFYLSEFPIKNCNFWQKYYNGQIGEKVSFPKGAKCE